MLAKRRLTLLRSLLKLTKKHLQEIILITLPSPCLGQAGAREDLEDLRAHDEGYLGLGVSARRLASLLGRLGVLQVFEKGGHVLFVFVSGHVLVSVVVNIHVNIHAVHGSVGAGVVDDALVDGDVVQGAVDFVILRGSEQRGKPMSRNGSTNPLAH